MRTEARSLTGTSADGGTALNRKFSAGRTGYLFLRSAGARRCIPVWYGRDRKLWS
nr:MAG TPA: hypothetical protein [Caudoviricetes sp.]